MKCGSCMRDCKLYKVAKCEEKLFLNVLFTLLFLLMISSMFLNHEPLNPRFKPGHVRRMSVSISHSLPSLPVVSELVAI